MVLEASKRSYSIADRLDIRASADLFLTLIEVYSKSLLVCASLMESNKMDTNGKTIHFKDPASPKEISNLEKKLGVTFPNDFKEFLLQHNGMEMFEGVEILSIEGIIEYNEVQDFPEGVRFNWVLLWWKIRTHKSRNGLEYMLYLDSIDDFEDAVNLDSNFEIYLIC